MTRHFSADLDEIFTDHEPDYQSFGIHSCVLEKGDS